MRLTLHTDYALRVLVHVGLREGDLVTISEIADCYGISKNHLTKVVHQLGRAGYLETVRGKYGGVRLLVQPEKVRLGEFVRRTEEDFALARCMRDDGDCDGEAACLLQGACIARMAFSQGLSAFFETLDRYTLADMIAAECGRTPVREAACA
ncbi:MAG TPA: Rrf2 family transcriptional regulator [Magnetospirillum sp.]|nr:Rrf2 family transcriptional regulator [Magnetospirillum sp.]